MTEGFETQDKLGTEEYEPNKLQLIHQIDKS